MTIDRTPRARCVLVLGTGSGAGASWLVAALCRWYARQGLRVAPFRAQHLGDDVRTVDGGPIGAATYLQALAACTLPQVGMNPVVRKPATGSGEEFLLLGEAQQALQALPPGARAQAAWPQAQRTFDQLRQAHDVVVIDGESAPADDISSDPDGLGRRIAQHANAPTLLVADIDRGGAFAHLYGTWLLLEQPQRACIQGFVLNKFRGDAALLAPAPQLLQQRTGVPTAATIPLCRELRLPTLEPMFDAHGSGTKAARITIAIVRGPHVGSLDEFQPLQHVPDVRVVWARECAELAAADWIVLPGSTDTPGDLAWMRARGLDRAVCAHAAAGRAVLGICAGLQLLGEALIDPDQIDGNAAGLGLLPLVTRFERQQTLARTRTTFGRLTGAWQALSGLVVEGYQVHHGQTGWAQAAQHPAMAAVGDVAQPVLPDDLGWCNGAGNVLGTYLHGLFEDAAVVRALFGSDAPTLDALFDGLADQIDMAFAPGALQALVE